MHDVLKAMAILGALDPGMYRHHDDDHQPRVKPATTKAVRRKRKAIKAARRKNRRK